MVLYKISRSVEVGKTAEDPDWQKLEVSKGTIIQWETWCHQLGADLLHWRVEYHHVQILPFSGSVWMDKIHRPFPMPEEIEISDPPYILDVYAYNEDTEKSHTYNIHVHIKPEKPVAVVSPTLAKRIIEFFE